MKLAIALLLASAAYGSSITSYQPVYFGACIGVPTCQPPSGTEFIRFTVLSTLAPAVAECTGSPCMVMVPMYADPYYYYKEYVGWSGNVIIRDPILYTFNVMTRADAPEPGALSLIMTGLLGMLGLALLRRQR